MTLAQKILAAAAFDERLAWDAVDTYSCTSDKSNMQIAINLARWQHASLQPLLTALAKVAEAAEMLQAQIDGRRKNWAGLWSKCPECGERFAAGGNWNRLTPASTCPECHTQAALAELRAIVKPNG